MLDLKQALARFGAEAKAKLANPSATGEPEDQLRAPLEGLFADLAHWWPDGKRCIRMFPWLAPRYIDCTVSSRCLYRANLD